MKYTEIGLSDAKKVFEDALENNYLVGAFNFNNLEQMQAVIEAAHETRSPIILQAAWGGVEHMKPAIFPYLVKGGVSYARQLAEAEGRTPVPILLNLDHGGSLEQCEACCRLGFSSIMIDGSHLSFEDNVKITKEAVAIARSFDGSISVEGELGLIGGEEEDISHNEKKFTDPKLAAEFIDRTGIDILAISIGTSHGAKKFSQRDLIEDKEGNMVPPPLKTDIVEEINALKPGFPLVLHGASAVPSEYVKEFNAAGGDLQQAIGIPDAYVCAMADTNICKVNIHSDGRIAFMARLRSGLQDKPSSVEERYFLGLGRDGMKDYYKYKMEKVLLSAGRC